MKTLKLNALSNATKLLPQGGCINVKLLRQGNGTGVNTISLSWSPSRQAEVKIRGGVFILPNGTETTSYFDWSLTEMKVRVDSEYAFIYVPYAAYSNLIGVFEINDGSDPNRPIIDYNFHMPYLYSRENMFNRNPTYNRPIYGVDFAKYLGSEIWTMFGLFKGLAQFNQPVNHINPSDSTVITNWFEDAYSFNQPLDKWDMSKVVSTYAAFRRAGSFNQDITMWNMANVTSMDSMFEFAVNFNQDISKWTYNKNVTMTEFLTNSGMQPDNYGKLLKKLRNTDFTGRTAPKILGATNIRYAAANQADRDWLVADGWTIIDAGISPI